MRQTVVGVFDSYADACAAQKALIEGGFSQADISIYAMLISGSSMRGPRVYAAGGADVRHSHSTPVFDQLEQLFARLFRPGGYPPETEDYREVIRRGGAILSADVSEVHVDLACDIMRRAGATDIGERTKAWRTEAGEQTKKEPIRGSQGAQERSSTYLPGQTDARRSAPSPEQPSTGQSSMESSEPVTAGGTLTQRADFSSAEQRMSGGMQQVSTRTEERPTAPETKPDPLRRSGAPLSVGPSSHAPDVEPVRTPTGTSAGLRARGEPRREDKASAGRAERASGTDYIGDPLKETPLEDAPHNDEFRRYHDTRAESGATDDEYQRAYTHGATFRQDDRYRGREWQEIEPSAREQWESRYPGSAWDRFKAAVRHGWERVTERR